MSTTITPPAEEQQIDSKAFIEQRNKEVQAAKEGKAAPAKPEKVETQEKTGEEPKPEAVRLPRSVRREMNRLREEAAEARGRLKAYEELGAKPAVPRGTPVETEDPEPKQVEFTTEADYHRALGRWEARQEAKKELGKRDTQTRSEKSQQEWTAHVAAMDKKMDEDIKTIKDWNEVKEAAQDLEFNREEHPALLDAIAGSDVRAYIWYHFAKHPEEFEKFFGESEPARKDFKTDQDYIVAMGPKAAKFRRLEGKLEVLYSKQPEAAQAPEKSKDDKSKDDLKDRTIPETRATAADRDVRKPRPSTEVAARGGSAPPNEPEIGSKAWMDLRNQATGGR